MQSKNCWESNKKERFWGTVIVLICTAVFLLPLPVKGALEEQQITSDGNDYLGGAVWLGQSFTANETYTLDKVKVKIYRVGTPGTITAEIKLADGDDKPTGSVLTTGSLNGNAITEDTAGDWYEIDLTNYEVTGSTKYTLTLHCENNYTRWRDISTGGYAGGIYLYSANNGSTWTTDANYDYTFETYSVDPTPTPTPALTATSTTEQSLERMNWIILIGVGCAIFLGTFMFFAKL